MTATRDKKKSYPGRNYGMDIHYTMPYISRAIYANNILNEYIISFIIRQIYLYYDIYVYIASFVKYIFDDIHNLSRPTQQIVMQARIWVT